MILIIINFYLNLEMGLGSGLGPRLAIESGPNLIKEGKGFLNSNVLSNNNNNYYY